MKVVVANMRAGYLDDDDPRITTMLILGMTIWVQRWYQSSEKATSEQIADAAIRLLRTRHGGAAADRHPTTRRRSSTGTR